ncbi:MAG: phage tail sheath protein [Oscillospiraceae bacterium]|nr:phage tail sheath protein [Oscillospiraceae bacterium]
MGLPELTFSLKKAADNVATRVSAGIVAMILRDANSNGLHTINRESDIPADLGVANIAAIKRAMVGYITKPDVVYVSVIGADADIETGFQALAAHSYDYLAGPVDISADDASALAELVKTQRVKRYVGKAVLPSVAADDEGVINFVATGIKAGDTTFTAAQYAGRIAGILAGTPAECSATYAALEELTGVDAVDDPDADVDAGKLFLIDDGRRVKLSRAVTSKTTLGEDEPDMLKKIKLVAALDLIRYYAITTVEDEYLGKCANTYDNKCILLVAFSDFFASLEAQNVIQEGSSGAELDAEAIRTYLLEQAEATGDAAEVARVQALSDEALRKEDTGSHVFLHLYGHVLDAMEDFHITLEAQ